MLTVRWVHAIVLLVLVIWLIPIRRYQLPFHLPFNLEPYRLLIALLFVALVAGAVMGRMRISTAKHGKPIVLLAAAAVGGVLLNYGPIQAAGLETQSLKSLSFFLSYLIAFALVASTIRTREDAEAVIAVIVAGAVVVALAALYESRRRHNLFNDLDRWIPFLNQTGEDRFNIRRGRLRVRASAQHPIALGALLTMTVPLALYLTRYAKTALRRRAAALSALLIAAAAIATVSRTIGLVFVAVVVVGVVVRGRAVLRFAPLVLVLAIVTHLATPTAIQQLYRAYTPQRGLVGEQATREGQGGSGRVADVVPGIQLWKQNPIVGRGLGVGPTTGIDPGALDPLEADAQGVIFDDEYLTTLVSLGALGFAGLLWFVWGGVVKLVLSARRALGRSRDLMLACAASGAGFGLSMLTYDAFSFVQVTLLFFIIVAIGLRVREVVEQ